tara:strand:+ start:2772 stop:3374 length:603 start_codon:yes stop_codon:yes gene_type:complete
MFKQYMNDQVQKCYRELLKNDLVDTFKQYNKDFKVIKEKLNKKINSTIDKIQMLKRNKVIILSGYPGSGKSSITNMFKKLEGYKILSMDDNIKNYKELSKKTKTEVQRRKTKFIVLDGTFLKQSDLDEFQWVEKQKGYDLLFVKLDIPKEFSYYNNIKRCLDKRNDRTLVPFKTYENMEKNSNIELPSKGVYLIGINEYA